jgi:sigma-B regulation protein RsbU (phosphoserine phosphatase)
MVSPNTRQRIAELTTLNALAQTLNQALDLRDALDTALAHIVELMDLRTGWIFLYDEQQFALAARHELPPAISYPGPAWHDSCACQDLCHEGKLDKAVNMVRCSRLRGAVGDKRGLAQHASIALRNQDSIVGILNVATTEWGSFSTPQLHLLSAIGSMLATAIVRAQLHEQVKVRRMREQAALIKLSQELLVSDALESSLQRLVRVGARLLEADACAFVEADEEGMRAVLRAAWGWKLPDESPWPLTLDAESPHLWYLPESASDLPRDALQKLPSLLARQRFLGHALVGVDLAGVPVGTLMVNMHSPRRFLPDEIQLLDMLGSQLAQTLERERLHQEALERRSLERELELARDIQASFLPRGCPRIPGYDIAAYYSPARHVGGDFYDFIEMAGDDIQLGLLIADVTDKGVPAALFMALSRTLLRANAIDGKPPATVLEQTNRLILADSHAGLFVTCFYAVLHAASGTLTFANGGHNYPLLYRQASGELRVLRAQGIVLGIVPEPHFEQSHETLVSGDVVLFYTDGVTEAMNSQHDLFGEDRLEAVLRQHHQRPAHEIIQAVLEAVEAFGEGESQSDDITMVVVRCCPNHSDHRPRRER